VNNLANSNEHQEILIELRKTLNDHLISSNDLSFFPEPYFLENGISDVTAFSQKNKDQIKKLLTISNLALSNFDEVSNEIEKILDDENPWVRYWGLIVCSSFGEKAMNFSEKIDFIFQNDSENLVKMRAVEFMLLNNINVSESKINSLLKSAKSESEANLMLNTLALVKTQNPNFKLNLKKEVFSENWIPPKREENALVNRRMNYLTNNE
jgi:hypothetical protein